MSAHLLIFFKMDEETMGDTHYATQQQHYQRVHPKPTAHNSQMLIQKTFTGTQSIQKLKYTNQSTLLQLLQSIFDDVTLYNDDEIRGVLKKSEKGFISIEDIMGMGIFREFMQRNVDVYISPDQICRVVNEQSKKLVAVNYRIKRVDAFVDNISNQVLKSVYIQKLPTKSTNQIFEFFKNIVGVVYQIYHKKNQRWAIIVIDNYEALELIKDQLYYGANKLTVLSPIQTLSSYGENQRLSSQFNIVRLYNNKCLFEANESDEEREEFEQRKYLQDKFKKFEQAQNYDDDDDEEEEEDEDEKQFLRSFESGRVSNYDYKNPKQSSRQKPRQRGPPNHKTSSRNSKKQFDKVMNYDNSPLLALRGGWNSGMVE